MNLGKKKGIIVGLVVITTLTVLISTLPIENFARNNGGVGDGDIDLLDGGNCAGAFGCHGQESLVPISMTFEPAPPYTPGQTPIHLNVTINMAAAAADSEAGISVRVGPSGGGNARLGIENDGWVIIDDPKNQPGTLNYVEYPDAQVPAGDWTLQWNVTAPSTPATYYVESTVWYAGTGTPYDISSEHTILVSAPADTQPPEVSNVLINGASTQTYPLSSIPVLTLTGTLDDSATGNSDIGGANYTVGAQQWGTSQPMTLQNPPTSPTEVFEATIPAPTQVGSYTYYVYGSDVQPNYNTTNVLEFATLTITDDLPPEISTVLINGAPSQTYPISSIPLLTLTAIFDDSGTGDSDIGGANYTIGAQQWASSQPMNLQNPPTSPTEVYDAIIPAPASPGVYEYYPYGSDTVPNYNISNTLDFATLTITDDIPPEISNVRVDGQVTKTVVAGTMVTLNATVDDTNTGNSNIANANYTIGAANWPGTDMNPVLPPFNNPMEDVTQTIDTTGWINGNYEIYVYGQDDVPNYNTTSTEFATIIIASELIPPEISNVQINGAAMQTYPLSSIPALTLTASVDDSLTGNSDVGGANYTIGAQQWGSSQPMTLQNPPTSPTEVMEATLIPPTQAGIYTYYVYAWDANMNYNSSNMLEFATLTITDDLAPEVSNALVDGLAMTTVTAGTIVTLTATVDDSNTGNSNVDDANYTIGMAAWPGTGMNPVVPPFDSPTEDVTQTIDTTGWPDASYDIYVYARDNVPNGNITSTAYATITILSDSTPPEINNVLIDGMATASYPLSLLPPTVTLTATIDDTNTGGLFVGGANFTTPTSTSWPGTPMNPVLAPLDSPLEDMTATFAPPSMPGTYNYYVHGWDNGPNYNNSAPFATLVITDDLPPEITTVQINGASTLNVPFSSIPALALTANLNDSSTGGSNIGGANYTTPSSNSWPGVPMNPVMAPFDNPVEDVSATLSAPTVPGTYYYYLHAWDDITNYNTSAPFATLVVEDDIAPEVSNVLVDGLATTTVSAGTSVTLNATIDDSNTGNSDVGGANYTIGAQSWPGTAMNPVNPPFDAPTEDVTVVIDTTGWTPGSYDIYVYGTDAAVPTPNGNSTSTAFATIIISSPPINNAPTLDWTGETDYVSDGLHPEIGDDTTTFVYRVKYMDSDDDAPASGDPKLHIEKGGTEISGSPFSMTFVSGTYTAGAIYTYSLTLSEGSDYSYFFTASDDQGSTATPTQEKNAPVVTGLGDTTPPASPSNLNVTSPGTSGNLVITWDPNTESDLAGYRIYRSNTSGSGYIEVGTVSKLVTSFTDTGLEDGKTYYYVITALDSSGNESPYSDESQGTPQVLTPPDDGDEELIPLPWLVIMILVIVNFILALILLWRRMKRNGEVFLPQEFEETEPVEPERTETTEDDQVKESELPPPPQD
jgi:hypothetical protein